MLLPSELVRCTDETFQLIKNKTIVTKLQQQTFMAHHSIGMFGMEELQRSKSRKEDNDVQHI